MADAVVGVEAAVSEQAIQAASKFVREHVDGTVAEKQWPVKRSQIAGLREIAKNEPESLEKFAESQRARAAARSAETEREFWQDIKNLCGGVASKFTWSLRQAREAALPSHLQIEKLPSGTNLSKEQQQERKQTERQQKQWMAEWNQQYFPLFFQRFCAEYVYQMSQRTDYPPKR